MLVLTRKQGERIVVGGAITVTVIAVRGGRVKLGFNGPPEVSIHREELHRRIGRHGGPHDRIEELPPVAASA